MLSSYLHEAKIFIRNLAEWLLLLAIGTVFFFSFGLKEVVVAGKSFVLALPTSVSFAAQFFNHLTTALIPEGVTLIVTNPLSAFTAQIKIALLLAFIFTLPFLLYRLFLYFFPALFASERTSILKIAVPSALLFALGAIFAYLVLIPPTFAILYSYTDSIGATPFFTVGEFVSLVLALVIATGIMFLLPVLMVLLSRFGVVSPRFWQANWRYSLVFFLIVSAIITPDGSGVTMLILSLPMAGLYGVGQLVSRRMYVHPAGRRKSEGYKLKRTL